MSQEESVGPDGLEHTGAAGDIGAPGLPDVETDFASGHSTISVLTEQDSGSRMSGSKLESGKLYLWFFLAMLFFSFFLLYYLVRPFLDSIILACVFTAISQPLYSFCLKLTRNRRFLAAFIVLLGISLVIALLIAVFVAGLIPQAKTSISTVILWLGGNHLGEVLSTHIEPLLQTLQQHVPGFEEVSIMDIRTNLTLLSSRAGQYLLGSASSLVTNTVSFFANLALTLLIMFFLLIDGPHLLQRISYLVPLRPEQTSVVIESLRRMSRAVLVGGFCVAALQGIVGGIGLAIVGIPALFWGTVMVFAALVPVLGTSLVWGPAVISLFIMGEWKSAVFLLVWCGVLVTSIDSILRPILMRDGAKVPIIFLFLSILGGINVFGVLGLLYGPMILGLVAVMLDLYAEEYHAALYNRFQKSDTIGS